MKLFDKFTDSLANKVLNVLTAADIFKSGGDISTIDTNVSVSKALRISAVMACVRVLSESIASLPLILYRRTPDGDRERASELPLYRLMHDKPNSVQTAFQFIEMLQTHLALNGNALCEKVKQGDQVVELVPLHPVFNWSQAKNGLIVYHAHRLNTRENVTLTQNQVFHVPFMPFDDGVQGLSPISYARRTINLADSAEGYGEGQFKSGATQRVALIAPDGKRLDEPAVERIRESFDQMYAGNSNSVLLKGGMDAKVIGMSAQDAQYLETRRFQVEEIARLYRVPPHMIGDLERATFSNIEHQSQAFVDYTLRPWLVRWEQALNRDLLNNSKKYYYEFLVDGLLRGDTLARAEANRKALGNRNNGEPGWKTVEEIRVSENLSREPKYGELVTGVENTDGQEQTDE